MRLNKRQVRNIALATLALCALLLLNLGTTEQPIESAFIQAPILSLSARSSIVPVDSQGFNVEVLVSGAVSLGAFDVQALGGYLFDSSLAVFVFSNDIGGTLLNNSGSSMKDLSPT